MIQNLSSIVVFGVRAHEFAAKTHVFGQLVIIVIIMKVGTR